MVEDLDDVLDHGLKAGDLVRTPSSSQRKA
jgi:hypothetical protein